VGAGFNAFGIASGGGAGMALAEWVVKGAPPFDLWPVDIRRFGRPHRDVAWVRARTLEAYGKHYTIAWPGEEHASGRPCRRSPLYGRLREAGACFGEKLGWERPNWFADRLSGEQPRDIYTFGRPNWFDAVAREHRAAREAAVLIDQTSFAKFVVQGPEAAAALGWICAGEVEKPVGRLTYTQMLNDRGGIEADLTVARTGRECFYVVTGTGFATHDLDWIAKGIPEGARAEVVDVTSAFGVLSLMGPKARAILSRVTAEDVSNAAFPFGHVRVLPIAGAPVTALRVTYVGELGWELHVPTESVISVYEALMVAGREHGLVNAGLSRDRDPAAGEGLSRLGGGDRAGPHAGGGGARLGGEAALEQAVPGARGGGGAGLGRGEEAARRVQRRSGRGAARARDDLSERRAGRLAGERRLRAYGGAGDRLRLRAAGRGRGPGLGAGGELRAGGRDRAGAV
jgi:sarcosine dehydrogenase